MANWTLPEGWDSGIITNHLVDTDGDGALDSVEIVVNGGQPLEPIHYVDIGRGSWGLVGGLSFGDNGQMGIFTGVGLPGLQFGVGSEESGQLPSGWETDSAPGVILRSGAMPIAGYDKIYWNPENGQSYRSGEVYDAYANEYVTPSELQLRTQER